MNISFIPEACVGEKAQFEGALVIRLPSAEERCDYMAEANINFAEVREGINNSALKPMGMLIRKSYDHIVKVDLKKKSDGKKVNSIEDLKYDPDCFGILTEIAGKLMSGGFVLGKS